MSHPSHPFNRPHLFSIAFVCFKDFPKKSHQSEGGVLYSPLFVLTIFFSARVDLDRSTNSSLNSTGNRSFNSSQDAGCQAEFPDPTPRSAYWSEIHPVGYDSSITAPEKPEPFPNPKKSRTASKNGINASLRKNSHWVYPVLVALVIGAGVVHFRNQTPEVTENHDRKPEVIFEPVQAQPEVQLATMSLECEQKMDDMVGQIKAEIRLNEKRIEEKLDFFSGIDDKLDQLKIEQEKMDQKIEKRDLEKTRNGSAPKRGHRNVSQRRGLK